MESVRRLSSPESDQLGDCYIGPEGEEDALNYFQRMMEYSLTGLTRDDTRADDERRAPGDQVEPVQLSR